MGQHNTEQNKNANVISQTNLIGGNYSKKWTGRLDEMNNQRYQADILGSHVAEN